MNVLWCSRAGLTLGVALCASLLTSRPTATGQTVSNADRSKTGFGRSATAGRTLLTPAARPTLATEVAGITSPHRTTTLAALQPSRIVRLEAAEGQMVQEGELLVVLDDGVQRIRAGKVKADAESLLDIELARLEMRQASADLERLRHLNVEFSATNQELRKAEIDAEKARLLYEVAMFEHQQAAREYEYQQLILERLHIRAPFSGYVTEVLREVGETVMEAEEILRIVELDPLEISVDCPLELAQAVRVGEHVHVRPADPQWEPRIGTIVLASRVADPGSQTFKAKLIVDNSDAGWRSGLKVFVDFSTSSVSKEDVRIGGGTSPTGGADLTPTTKEGPAGKYFERQDSN